jgi:hypothetical protein
MFKSSKADFPASIELFVVAIPLCLGISLTLFKIYKTYCPCSGEFNSVGILKN